MKKTLIALAVAGISFNALAVDLDAANKVAAKFVKEQTLTATTEVGSDTPLEVKVKVGFALTTPYVRFDLDNGATFDADPALAGTRTWSKSAGGAGESFVIFNSAAGAASDEDLTLSAVLNLVNKNDVDVTYTVYETASNAVNKTGNLVNGKTGTLLTFVDGLTVSATQATDLEKIDISDAGAGKKFDDTVSDDATNFANLNVDVTTDALLLDGTSAAIDDLLTSYSWTVDGDFSAADSLEDSTTTTAQSFIINTDKNQAVLNIADVSAPVANPVVYTVDGTTVIPDGAYSVTFTPVSAGNFVFGATEFENAVQVKKNGSTAEVELALNPNGAYANFIRITNKTSKAGNVALTLIDDAGVSYPTTLGAVLGADKASLAGGASTDQINISAIATVANVPATYAGKLRLVVDAQVPTQTDLNGEIVSGIAVQSYAANTNNGVLTLLK